MIVKLSYIINVRTLKSFQI